LVNSESETQNTPTRSEKKGGGKGVKGESGEIRPSRAVKERKQRNFSLHSGGGQHKKKGGGGSEEGGKTLKQRENTTMLEQSPGRNSNAPTRKKTNTQKGKGKGDSQVASTRKRHFSNKSNPTAKESMTSSTEDLGDSSPTKKNRGDFR